MTSMNMQCLLYLMVTLVCLFDRLCLLTTFASFTFCIGSLASKFCAEKLPAMVTEVEKERLIGLKESADPEFKKVWGDDSYFVKAYVRCDEELKQHHINLSIQPEMGAGTTCIAVYCRLPKASGNKYEIICTNVGDSRAVLFDGTVSGDESGCSTPDLEKKIIPLSEDQKPSNPKERKRIEEAGKTVAMGRVMSNLAVARAFGDFRYKDNNNLPATKQAVCVDPEIRRVFIERSKNKNQYQFIVLGCDGLWDKMSNAEVCGFICNKFDAYQIFDENHSVDESYLVPIRETWMDVDVENWTNDHTEAWFDAINHRFKRHFKSLFENGKELCKCQDQEYWDELMKKKDAIECVHEFDESIGLEFRNVLLNEIKRNRKSKEPVKDTVQKLRLITEQLIDHAVFTKGSEDNVSATIVLLRPCEK
jgi:serine/threonine protein phosphatase PrpC